MDLAGNGGGDGQGHVILRDGLPDGNVREVEAVHNVAGQHRVVRIIGVGIPGGIGVTQNRDGVIAVGIAVALGAVLVVRVAAVKYDVRKRRAGIVGDAAVEEGVAFVEGDIDVGHVAAGGVRLHGVLGNDVSAAGRPFLVRADFPEVGRDGNGVVAVGVGEIDAKQTAGLRLKHHAAHPIAVAGVINVARNRDCAVGQGEVVCGGHAVGNGHLRRNGLVAEIIGHDRQQYIAARINVDAVMSVVVCHYRADIAVAVR